MKFVASLWHLGLIPNRVLPLRWIDYDLFWKLSYHVVMWEAFGGSFCYLEAQ